MTGTAHYDFDIPRTALGEGTYSISGAVADRAGAELHRMREGAWIVVAGGGTEIGFVSLAPSLSRVPALDERRMRTVQH